ncbi:right-handed parallel beta-helix repeat-containing protein [Candidatus Woesearchaeota archaeon]|nr:right-handed parallel beta-helix repeat-containing protein [Candidatus Woesearchaeota archaeon]
MKIFPFLLIGIILLVISCTTGPSETGKLEKADSNINENSNFTGNLSINPANEPVEGGKPEESSPNLAEQPVIFPSQKMPANPIPGPEESLSKIPLFKEEDYLEILSAIQINKLKIAEAVQSLAIRSPNVILDNCQGEVCYVNNLEISLDGAHLDCGGKKLLPKGEAKIAVTVIADGVSIINCQIDSFKKRGILVLGSGNILAYNTITNNPEGGIIIEGNSNLLFNNDFKDNKWANLEIKAKSSQNIIYNNSMIDTDGLYQPYTNAFAAIGISGSDNVILENIIQNNAEVGIKLTPFHSDEPPPTRNLIARNHVNNSGVLGLEITGAVGGPRGSEEFPESPISEGRNIAFNNSFTYSKKEMGLRVRWSNYNEIIGNTIQGNNWMGLHLLLANGSIIEKNKIIDNQGGIWLGAAEGSIIEGNIIFHNHQHCGILFTDGLGLLSTNNKAIRNLLEGNEDWHDEKQICDDGGNFLLNNSFK